MMPFFIRNPFFWLSLKLKGSSMSGAVRASGLANIDIGRGVRISHSSELHARMGRIHIEDKVQIGPYVIFRPGGGEIKLGRKVNIGAFCLMEARGGLIEIGENSSVNPYSVLYGHGSLKIGKDCIIASGTTFIPANHVFNSLEKNIKDQGETKKGIIIEDNVWIASKVTVLDGVTIGKGSVIGAGAVVTKSVPPYAVAVGIPARVIRSRKNESGKDF